MLGLVESFSNKRLAFQREQTVPHYWRTCFSIAMQNEFLDRLIKEGKESLLESSITHIVTLITLSLSVIKDLTSSFLIFPPKSSQFPKPQNLPQLLLILICFSPEKRTTT